MRHQKSGRHLNRTSAHRKAMLSNMSASLIEHETIKTTVVKAKELRRFVEPLITLSKTDSVANRRRAFAKLRNKAAVGKLFSDLGPRYQTRQGGYTRILKAGFRQGDSAMVAYMQLVDQPAQLVEQQPEPLLADAGTDDTDVESTVEAEETIVEAEAQVDEAAEVEEVTSEAEATSEDTVGSDEASSTSESTEADADPSTTDDAKPKT